MKNKSADKLVNQKKISKTTEILIWRVPKNLKTRFKVLCAENNTPMREELINLIKKRCTELERKRKPVEQPNTGK